MTGVFQTIRVIDFETTGFKPPEAKAVEIGWTDLTYYPEGWIIGNRPQSKLIDPCSPIPAEASAIHNITDAMVSGAGVASEVLPEVFSLGEVYAAHNVQFDRQFAPSSASNWICTLKCARKIYPELKSHTNQYLRYALDLNVDDSLANPPHRAGADSFVTAYLLAHLLKKESIETLLKYSQGKSHPLHLKFGKHKGKRFSEVPEDYLRWITGSDLSDEIKDAARAELKRRAEQ